jgi:hypothetical protein
MRLAPENVSLLVQKAFCLEVLADKEGCTSRFVDLDGKPLEDFIMAGLNAGAEFYKVAEDHLSKDKSIYKRYVETLKASQIHKSQKYINFGLLEIMFPAVAARMSCDNPQKIIEHIIKIMKNGTKQDVANMISARKLAWSSSTKRQQKLSELTPRVVAATSPYEFYERIAELPNLVSSAYQWSQHYKDGLPLLKVQFEHLQQTQGQLLERLKTGFDPLKKQYPEIKIGILADMCAAALFLHLSFTED